jgi:hypothetical protein
MSSTCFKPEYKTRVLHTSLWEHIWVSVGRPQAINIKLVEVLYSVLLDDVNNWGPSFYK